MLFVRLKWIFVPDLTNIIPAKFGSIWSTSLRETIKMWKVYEKGKLSSHDPFSKDFGNVKSINYTNSISTKACNAKINFSSK
jgi:hypothetical protein